MSVDRLRQTILEALRQDSRVDEREIDLRVQEGVVYLEGAVDSAAERRAAREDIENIPGVRSVVDHLQLKNYIPREDDELAESVRIDLMRDPYVDASRIQIQAHQGEVRLEGRVRTYAEKSAAENVAWWSPGVTNVISHLGVEERLPPEE